MSVYKRGGIWWYKFQFQGIHIRESTHSSSKEIASRAERERRRKLELGANVLEEVRRPQMLAVAMDSWLKGHPHWSPNTRRINRSLCGHIRPVLGRLLIAEVSGDHIARYQTLRMRSKASPKSINLEVAAIRQILREQGYWAHLDGKVKMLPVRERVGRALSADEIMRIEEAAKKTRSRSLPVALRLFRFTGMRLSELRLMKWGQVDLKEGYVVVGKGKTRAGEGRRIELAPSALAALLEWRGLFPEAKPSHYLFPSERYGQDGSVYSSKPEKPIGRWKTAWDTCRRIAGVKCRTHDLRHSFVSRLAESPEVSDATLMALTGHVSKRMLEHYTHSRIEAKRRAVALLE